jgi:hypothetical protein
MDGEGVEMRDDQRPDFLELLIGCAELYQRQISEVVIEVFWKVLRPYDLAVVKGAVEAHVRLSPFMPTPHELLKHIHGGTADELAAKAWPMVKHLLRDTLMDDHKTLLPDGAAALAARDMVRGKITRAEVQYHFEFFKVAYRRHFLDGRHETPLVFEWPRTLDHRTGEPEYDQVPILFTDFWPPHEVRRHRALLEDFQPGNHLVKRLPEGRETPGVARVG